ncbi:Lysylphosphatidylglycerol synthase TM region [Reichenbachiella agariperforans]|uniref:Lysylphosphatidylglycerol synthase TM region n=1 Tax=Reichenbachiella agariperforans TaxID=156994 RepID=A0A1M6LD98_REIAG|nr:lysylphosphatidylglycerol synthase domain-containing protein [Reichenbachiella agariperforans]SHJ69211.1 Lysylphosphatidylglycerol synthase TM region [Reichenbachiella agariperforans]
METLKSTSIGARQSWVNIAKLLWGWGLPVTVLVILALRLENGVWRTYSWEYLEISYLAVALVLLPLNLGLEAYKWRYMTQFSVKRKFVDVLKLVLAGRAVNMITPLGLGDAVVRVGDIEPEQRMKAIAVLAMARVSQMVPTLVLGGMATVFLLRQGVEVFDSGRLQWVLVGLVSLVLLGFLTRKRVSDWLGEYYQYFICFDIWQWVTILLLSFLRYAVFSVQFCLVFYGLEIGLDFQVVLLGVFWVFLVKTVIPNMTILGDLMKREISAVLFFSLFTSDLMLISVGSAVVWLINIVIPSVLGLAYVSRFRPRLS